jgi:PhnB protein
MAVSAVPPNYPKCSPYLVVKGGADALDFYQRAFGAVERMRMPMPDGRIGHAEIEVEGAVIMLADEHPEMGFVSPATLGGSPVTIHIYVNDVDAFCKRAVDAGATLTRPVTDQFYGDRSGQLTDPYGHSWSIATHVEDVSPEEMQRRAAKLHG